MADQLKAAKSRRAALLGLGTLAVAGSMAVAGVALSSASSPASASPAASGDGCPSGSATVTVGGQASVNGTPDMATLSLGVEDQAPTAKAALAGNAAKSNALIARLEKNGVPASRIQTSGISLQPTYNNHNAITGYDVSNSLTVTLLDIPAAGQVIDAVTSVAGNAARVDGISFSFRSEDKLMGEARQAAVRQATQQASLMASAAGSTLGRLCLLRDQSAQGQQPQPEAVPYAVHASAAPSVQPGTLQVTANVTAVYQLVPAR